MTFILKIRQYFETSHNRIEDKQSGTDGVIDLGCGIYKCLASINTFGTR